MDYKKATDTIKWHSQHSDLNGSEARLIMFMVASCNRTSRLQASLSDLAESVALSKASVANAIKSLEAKKAISIEAPASGRMVATYHVRTADDLNAYFIAEQNNPAADDWHDRHERFADLEFARSTIGDDCEDCSEDGLCHIHQFKAKQIEDTIEWREYRLWLADNPKPPAKIGTIKGRKVAIHD